MTVTSLSRLPVADASVAAASGTSHDDALVVDGFGALVAAHLATLAGTAEQAATGMAATAATAGSVDIETADDSEKLAAGEVSDLDETATAAEAGGAGEAASLVAVPVSMPALVPVPLRITAPGEGSPSTVPPVTDVGESGTMVDDSAGGGAATWAASDPAPATPGPLTQLPATGATADAGPVTILPGADLDGTATHPTATAEAEPTAGAGSASVMGGVDASAATPLVGPGPASLAGPASTTGQTSAGPIASQVFPTVPTLVSRGEGTHSITLRLHPADLGEVHVTVTVRDGVVQVTLAADAEAQEALRAGSGELRSLLDLACAQGGQVVVRDLPSGPAAGHATTTTTSSGSFQLPTGQASTEGGAGRQDGDAPGSGRGRAEASSDDVMSSGTTPRPQTRAAAGLDLTL